MYRLGRGPSTVTVASIDQMMAALWNPSTSVNLWIKEVHWTRNSGTVQTSLRLVRISTEGATFAGGTVSSTIDSDDDGHVAPPSGARINLGAATTQPTIIATDMGRWRAIGSPGDAFFYVFPDRGLKILPGRGLALVNNSGTIALEPHNATFVWDEDFI